LFTVRASEKNFEYRLIFGEDMKNDKVGRFLRHGVYTLQCVSRRVQSERTQLKWTASNTT